LASLRKARPLYILSGEMPESMKKASAAQKNTFKKNPTFAGFIFFVIDSIYSSNI